MIPHADFADVTMAAYRHLHTNLISPPHSTCSEDVDMTARNTGSPVPLPNGFQPLSCLRCARRKVGCDRLYPCSKCTKNNVLCEFPQPRTDKRKRRKTPLASSSALSSSASINTLYTRLDRYEEMLKGLGVDVESIGISNSPRSRGAADSPKRDAGAGDTYAPRQETIDKATSGHLVVNGKRSRHIEMEANVWTKAGDDLNAGTFLPGSSDDEDDEIGFSTSIEHKAGTGGLVLGLLPGTASVEDLYPPQQHFSKLWQVYLSNIQPVTMILHAPSTSVVLAEAAKGHGHAPTDAEVLLFAVMACALISITDADCMRTLAEKRSTLLSRYRLGCELALINANFLISSNFGVLQAYVIYLFAVSSEVDPRELWNITGIAKRNAQRLGLHQEKSVTSLTPFEVEMRRRLWYQIVMFDAISASIAGLHGPESNYDVTAPSNINDSDLSPTMKGPPKVRTGATDMIFCNLRYKIIKFMDKVNCGWKPASISSERWTSTVDQSYRAEKGKVIDELEKEIELDLLRYCDSLNPVHFLTAIVARLTLCKLRFMMFHPSQYNKHLNDFTAEDRELVFSTALRVLEYENNAHSHSSVQGFLWHMHQDFQSSCLVHILEDLRTRPYGEQAEKAWEQIHMLYERRPILYQGQKQKLPLYTAINKMIVEAWRVREIHASEYGQALVVPTYITMLRAQEQRAGSKLHAANSQPPSTANSSQTSKYPADRGPLHPGTFEQEMANWPGWPNFNITSSNLGSMDMNVFDSMPSLNPEIPMSHSSDLSQAQDLLLPLAWTGQCGDKS